MQVNVVGGPQRPFRKYQGTIGGLSISILLISCANSALSNGEEETTPRTDDPFQNDAFWNSNQNEDPTNTQNTDPKMNQSTDPSPMTFDCNSTEICDGLDNDCDELVDEQLFCNCTEDASCYGGPMSTRGVGLCTDGVRECIDNGELWGECMAWVGPTDEQCDGLDNDCDGRVDEAGPEGCGCGEPPPEACDGIDNDCDGMVDEGFASHCSSCTQASEEVCDFTDNDCDGSIDEGVCVVTDIDINDDCVTVSCPANAPHPISCDINFEGGDPRGCVAFTPGESTVYLQEGNRCGSGRVVGTLVCSVTQGDGLNEMNCPINKPERSYPRDPDGCAETN